MQTETQSMLCSLQMCNTRLSLARTPSPRVMIRDASKRKIYSERLLLRTINTQLTFNILWSVGDNYNFVKMAMTIDIA